MQNVHTADDGSVKFICPHLNDFNTDADVGMIKTGHAWTKSCISCVAQHIGTALRDGASDNQIARSVSFHCCSHHKRKNAGCLGCLASVKKVIWRVWFAFAPNQVLYLLHKSIRPSAKRLTPCSNGG